MKKVQKRAPKDYSQALRRRFQLGFLLLNLWVTQNRPRRDT